MTKTLVPRTHLECKAPLNNIQPMAGVKVKMPCYCSSYAFPHRPGSGKCSANTLMTRFRSGAIVRQCEQLCQLCGQPAEVETFDEGIGHYEFWGSVGNDVRLVEATTCCHSNLEDNSMANKRLFKWYPPRKGDVK